MSLQDELHHIFETSRQRELEWMESLTDEERSSAGTFEEWSAKDIVAHASYWQQVRAKRSLAWVRGENLEPAPQFQAANAQVFDRFSGRTWDEIEGFAQQAHKDMVEAIRAMEEDELRGPSEQSEGQKMWESLVGTGYTHKLLHYSEYDQERGKTQLASQLWKEWAQLVSPLDSGPEWQGGVHYNAACSLALTGDPEGALEELRRGLKLRPSLTAWSRRDSDLEILHDHPEYRALFAPEYWWEALEAGPQAESVADQFLRTLSMFRICVARFPGEGWREGESLYLRPAGLALHIAQTIYNYSAQEADERTDEPLMQVSWQQREASKLPSQAELLELLDKAGERLARFIAQADLEAKEDMFPWTGFTLFSRAIYTLRHTQHHLADLAMELKRRGLKPPEWQ